jgi:hypothetical protein
LKQHERHTFQAAIERLKHEHPLIDFDLEGADPAPSSLPDLHWAEKNAEPPAFSGEGSAVAIPLDDVKHAKRLERIKREERLERSKDELVASIHAHFGAGDLLIGADLRLFLIHAWNRELCRTPTNHKTLNEIMLRQLACKVGPQQQGAIERLGLVVGFLRAMRPELLTRFLDACRCHGGRLKGPFDTLEAYLSAVDAHLEK